MWFPRVADRDMVPDQERGRQTGGRGIPAMAPLWQLLRQRQRRRPRSRKVPSMSDFWPPPPDGVVGQRRLVSTVMVGDERGDDRADRASGGLFRGTRNAESQANVPPVTMSTGSTRRRCCVAEHCYKWYARKELERGIRNATGAEDVDTSAGGAMSAVTVRKAVGRSDLHRSAKPTRVRDTGAWLSFRREKVTGTPSIACRGPQPHARLHAILEAL